jgi:hypothetical protein
LAGEAPRGWSRREPSSLAGGGWQGAAGTAYARRAVGEEIFPVACGLDGVANLGDLAAAALGWKGPIDLLVNNATFLGEATFRLPGRALTGQLAVPGQPQRHRCWQSAGARHAGDWGKG